jgi:hypothetical protein
VSQRQYKTNRDAAKSVLRPKLDKGDRKPRTEKPYSCCGIEASGGVSENFRF